MKLTSKQIKWINEENKNLRDEFSSMSIPDKVSAAARLEAINVIIKLHNMEIPEKDYINIEELPEERI